MKLQLKGSLKKNGIEFLRFVFNGIEKITGQERTFFIEIDFINPAANPSEPILGFKPRVNVSEEDLQNVLAGTVSAQKIQSESLVLPSYIAARAGILGAGGKQICSYTSIKNISVSPKTFDIQAEHFHFSDESLSGKIECSKEELHEHPEFLCSAGTAEWNIRYEKQRCFPKGYKSKICRWTIPGARTIFAGSFIIDGKEFSLIPKKSFGYTEHFWGKSLPSSWFHLSSSHLTSHISGKLLQHSCFTLQGIFNGRISILADLEGTEIRFTADSPKRKYQSKQELLQAPDEENKEKLHWSVSTSNKQYVIDIDLFCKEEQLFVRSWEIPEGNRNILKILSGVSSDGEIRLYKKIRGSLELIEHASIASALCEYGQPEMPEQ